MKNFSLAIICLFITISSVFAQTDVSSLIANSEFDNSTMSNGAPSDWYQTVGATTSKISTAAKGDGSVIVTNQNHWQIWDEDGLTGKVYQLISNLPNGKYTVRAGLYATFGGTVKLYANETKTNVVNSASGYYSAIASVTDGKLEIGLEIATSGGQTTIEFDHITLAFSAFTLEEYNQVLQNKMADAAADTLNINNPGYINITELRTAILAGQTVAQNETAIATAITVLNSAIENYNSLFSTYQTLKTAITALQAQVVSCAYPNQDEITDAITQAQAIYDNPTDQRPNIAAIVITLNAKSKKLKQYKELGDAITEAQTVTNSIDYPGKSAYLMAITTAQSIYSNPANADLATAISTLRLAKNEYFNSQYSITPAQQTVSWVDTDLVGEEKFVTRLDGKPFYMTSIQVRLDKLKGYMNPFFDAAARHAVIQRAAADGFNTVGIPIFWSEVEPIKDEFDWTVLDEYLGYCKEFGLKMELLWFSWSSGGRVQYLTDNTQFGKTLRTPDYVCAMDGTSEFNVLRSEWEYSLDWRDTNLRSRETFVLGKIMEHLAFWDANNGSPHTVIGVQLGNEARANGNNTATSTEIINYYHAIGAAVKQSKYVVWTRLNCVSNETNGRIDANESKRNSGGTNIDFVGIDVYGTSASSLYGTMSNMKVSGKNYLMIMESGAEVSGAANYQMAAMAGGKAYSHYDMAGTDGHELYNVSNTTLVAKSHTADVRLVNKIMNLANQDIATKAQGNSMYVFNYAGSSIATETSCIEGLSFTPSTATSHGIAIRHSPTEIVLLTTKGGVFHYPASLKILEASRGRYEENNVWISDEIVPLGNDSILINGSYAVRLLLNNPDGWVINPEFDNSTMSGGAPYGWQSTVVASTSKISTIAKGDASVIIGGQNHWQIWNYGGLTGKMYQTISNLPNGTYTLRAGMFTSFGGTVKLYANDSTTNIVSGVSDYYTVTTRITNGTLEIGLDIITSEGQTSIEFDHVTLIREDNVGISPISNPDEIIERKYYNLQGILVNAQCITSLPMGIYIEKRICRSGKISTEKISINKK